MHCTNSSRSIHFIYFYFLCCYSVAKLNNIFISLNKCSIYLIVIKYACHLIWKLVKKIIVWKLILLVIFYSLWNSSSSELIILSVHHFLCVVGRAFLHFSFLKIFHLESPKRYKLFNSDFYPQNFGFVTLRLTFFLVS